MQSPDAATSAADTIGPSGGTVRLGGASITIPPGALSSPTTITIAVRADLPPPMYETYSAFYELGPAGLTFAIPAIVEMPPGAAPGSAAVYWSAPGGGTTYDALDTTFADGFATAPVTHFSTGFVGRLKRQVTPSEGGLDGPIEGGADGPADAIEEPPSSEAGHDAADSASDAGDATVHDAGLDTSASDVVCTGTVVACGGVCVDTSTDNGNCGGCGVVCSTTPPSTAQCTSGRCLVTLTTTPSYGLAIDTVNVYFTNGASDIYKVPLAGGAATSLATGTNANQMVTDGARVYWTDRATSDAGAILAVPVSGGSVTTLAAGRNQPISLAVDTTSVYWSEFASAGNIMSVPLSGGTPITLAPDRNVPTYLTVDSSSVYWYEWGPQVVLKVALDGGTPTTLANATDLPTMQGVPVVDSTSVYLSLSGGYIAKLPLDGMPDAGSPVVLASGLDDPEGIAIDSTNVYWVDSASAGVVQSMPLDGGTATTLASLDGPLWVAADATSLYWSSEQGVMKLTPK